MIGLEDVRSAALDRRRHVVVVGGGFGGLAAGYELARLGCRVTVFEADAELGGLAGTFTVGGRELEKFYHHWFVNDIHVMGLIREMGAESRVRVRPTNTGMYYANSVFRLSRPWDVLAFNPLSLANRVRLGLVLPRAKLVRDWRRLEGQTARDWLLGLCGPEVYRVVWEPLLVGKFGPYAGEVSAVWFWSKIALRGGSRDRGGRESLAYFEGGFQDLARLLAQRIRDLGGAVSTGTPVVGVVTEGGCVTAVHTAEGPVAADAVLATQALPLIADMLDGSVEPGYLARLRRIRYLANVCLVLELDRSLSETYWMNVNDPGYPFVGVIEHTNFEPAASYGNRHIIYLSKYLPDDHPWFHLDADALTEEALGHLARMFPRFERAWVMGSHVWRARYSQPIVERHYSSLIPSAQTPLRNLFISSMAQIYPEDRGTNYAIRHGRDTARLLLERMASAPVAAP